VARSPHVFYGVAVDTRVKHVTVARGRRRAPSVVGRVAVAVLAAALGVLGAVAAVGPALPAAAATTAGWADWEPLTGSAGRWATTMHLPAGGFPAAAVTSDSRGGQVGVQSGASAWLSEATPPGGVFGSSRDRPYLNLRPRADAATSPSTTTYTFERPTPAGGWAFVLGDLDADRAVVVARGADGEPLTGPELGWQGGFNYCAVSPGPSCSGDAADVATFDPVSGEVVGNAAGIDTSGTAGWFRPTVPVASLTISFFQRTGFPVYQTWFASLARDVSGTVDLVAADGTPTGQVVPGATLTLLGPDGTALATTTSAADGTYAFLGYTAAPGYSVELTTLPPAGGGYPFGLVPSGAPVVTDVDLSGTDATGVDLAAREIQPIAVSGTVLTDDGVPVPGATVTLTPVGGGAPFAAVTNSQGRYLVDDVSWNAPDPEDPTERPQRYTFSVSGLPAGYAVSSLPPDLTVEVGDEEPSTGNDVEVLAPASLSGTVTAGGAPVPGVVVTLVGPDGEVVATTTTAADGTYAFADLVPGNYTVGVLPPPGYALDGPAERDATVAASDVTGADFALARPGAVGGTVTDDAGAPVAGATVTVEGPGGAVELTTDAGGAYVLEGLAPGDYVVTLTPPGGYASAVPDLRVTLTAAGESVLDQDFVVTRAGTPTPTPPGGTGADPGGVPVGGVVPDAEGDGGGTADRAAGRGGGTLVTTGATTAPALGAALGLVVIGAALVSARRPRPGPERAPDGSRQARWS
jgi:hypothetical protein